MSIAPPCRLSTCSPTSALVDQNFSCVCSFHMPGISEENIKGMEENIKGMEVILEGIFPPNLEASGKCQREFLVLTSFTTIKPTLKLCFKHPSYLVILWNNGPLSGWLR